MAMREGEVGGDVGDKIEHRQSNHYNVINHSFLCTTPRHHALYKRVSSLVRAFSATCLSHRFTKLMTVNRIGNNEKPANAFSLLLDETHFPVAHE